MGFFSKVSDAVSKPFKDAGESIGKTIGGSSGRKIGSQIGGLMAPGGGANAAYDATKGISDKLTGSAGGLVTGGLTPGQAPGLPPTGIQQQLTSLNQGQPGMAAMGGMAGQQQQQPALGSTNIQQMSRSLAQNYGLAIGRGNIVDENGNFLMTPEQMAASSGMDVGDAAARMNMLGQAISKAQTEQQQKQGVAAIQTGLGQVQQRGRGSLATLQMGLYQDLADLYSNQEYAAADFSYWIQKEQMDVANALQAQQQKQSKKNDLIGGALSGASIGASFGPWGAAIGAGAGLLLGSDWF